jgi:hypothetical protein
VLDQLHGFEEDTRFIRTAYQDGRETQNLREHDAIPPSPKRLRRGQLSECVELSRLEIEHRKKLSICGRVCSEPLGGREGTLESTDGGNGRATGSQARPVKLALGPGAVPVLEILGEFGPKGVKLRSSRRP